MRTRRYTMALSASGVILIFASTLAAQSGITSNPSRLVSVSGVLRPADGQPLAPVELVTLAIYSDESGGTPLWYESQTVETDAAGRYTVLLGATQANGVPLEVFATGDARWIGITLVRPGEVEGLRRRLTSVPYALHASNAETLGGRPASAYMLAPPSSRDTLASAASSPTGRDGEASPLAALSGTTNYVAKFVNSVDVGDSAIYESGGRVGLGTTTPLDMMHIRFADTNGTSTGIAVQNLGATAASYSGMLFYDQAGQLVQFQGFNNATHEYRINNIARNGASVLDGSINFMIGSTSRFMVASNGNVGIGTVSPSAKLQVAGNAAINGSVVATELDYLTPQTSYYAVADAAFTSRDGVNVGSSTGNGGAYPTSSTGFGLAAPVNLPHGATITNVRFIYHDNSPSNLSLSLLAHNIAGGFYGAIAAHTSSVQTTSAQTVDVTPSGSFLTVDNSVRSLVVTAFPVGAWSDFSMQVRGVIITYTMPRPAR